MKIKIKFENIFVILSILFIFGCCVYYGSRLVKYYRVFNPKTETGEKTVLFSATIRQDNPVITEGDGLYIHNGDFIFKGEDVNNYVSYKEKTWRIMQVYRSGIVKLILDKPLSATQYDDANNSYDKSYIHSYIKDTNNLSLNVDNLEQIDICLDSIDDANNITCENKINDYISILGISDYGNSINLTTNKSYINSTDNIWLYNKNSDGLAWNITKGMLTQDETHLEYSVKPVIILKNTAYSESGNGTKDNPYIVKDGE